MGLDTVVVVPTYSQVYLDSQINRRSGSWLAAPHLHNTLTLAALQPAAQTETAPHPGWSFYSESGWQSGNTFQWEVIIIKYSDLVQCSRTTQIYMLRKSRSEQFPWQQTYLEISKFKSVVFIKCTYSWQKWIKILVWKRERKFFL